MCENFCYKFLKTLISHLLNESIFAEFLSPHPTPNRNFGDAIAVQDLREIHVWNSVRASPPPNQNPGVATDTVLTVLYTCKFTVNLQYYCSTVHSILNNSLLVICVLRYRTNLIRIDNNKTIFMEGLNVRLVYTTA